MCMLSKLNTVVKMTGWCNAGKAVRSEVADFIFHQASGDDEIERILRLFICSVGV